MRYSTDASAVLKKTPIKLPLLFSVFGGDLLSPLVSFLTSLFLLLL